MHLALRPVGAALAAISILGCPALADFVDVTQAAGISHTHAADPASDAPAAGAAFDADGDGWPDFVAGRLADTPVLYLNDGDGSFTESAASSGLDAAGHAVSFGAGDLDDDGDADLVAALADGSLRLLVNDGTGSFDEASVARGLVAAAGDAFSHAVTISTIDYDLDGFLDLFLSSWAETGEAARLLRNRGAAAPGHFEDATAAAGLSGAGPAGPSFAAAWADWSGDVWPDLLLLAGNGETAFYESLGGRKYGLDAVKAGPEAHARGVAMGDFDNDLTLDIFVSGSASNTLYRGDGDGAFVQMAQSAGVAQSGSSWGAAFLEFDNDGDLDLAVTNGAATAPDDPTMLFLNQGAGSFVDATASSGLSDSGLGKGLIVLDYDQDGDEDLIALQSGGSPRLYRNDIADANNSWIRITLEGVSSNRDAIGAMVTVVEGGIARKRWLVPTSSALGQRESALHFGLGASNGGIDEIVVTWPNGSKQILQNQTANQTLHIVEADDLAIPPRFERQLPPEISVVPASPLELSVEVAGQEGVSYFWEKDGVGLSGSNTPTLRFPRFSPLQAGTYRVVASNGGGALHSREVVVTMDFDAESRSTARWWNEFLLQAVRRNFPDPPVVARNTYHASAALWDAYWAYDDESWQRAQAVFHAEPVSQADWGEDRARSQQIAMCHAVYQVLRHRYQTAFGAEISVGEFRWLMNALNCDPDYHGTDGSDPASTGNRIGLAILAATVDDGSNEEGNYADTSGYLPVNAPLVYGVSGAEMIDPNRWQPLSLPLSVTKNGIVLGAQTQTFLTPSWGSVTPFALVDLSGTPGMPIDPGPPPLFGTDSHDEYVAQAIEVIKYASMLDPDDGATIDISPGALMNNRYFDYDNRGRAVNPFTGQPYPSNVVKRGDFWRLVAEFFSDGPGIEGPPGVWNMIHNQVTDDPRFERRLGGAGPEVSALEWDVHAYLALNGALHDAGIATWGIKNHYDFARPMSMVRYLCALGQSSDPEAASYHPQGITLQPGLIEVITPESAASGQRHAALADHVGEIAVYSWQGVPDDPAGHYSGVDWIRGVDWTPYHLKTFPTPNFAGYVSGHTVFSRAAAEVMTMLTGSPYFPGGLKEFPFAVNEFLRVEEGPSQALTIQCATYYDMADITGRARLYCGVHIRADDLNGRPVGAQVGIRSAMRTFALRNASGRPWPDRALVQNIASAPGAQAPLSRFDFLGDSARPLPIKRVAARQDLETAEAPGIYFAIDDANGPQYSWLAQGADLREIRLAGAAASETPVSVEIRVVGDEPTILLARASAEGELTLHSLKADAPAELARVEDWREAPLAMLGDVLATRSDSAQTLEEDLPAFPALLSAGQYRLQFTPASTEDVTEIRIQFLE